MISGTDVFSLDSSQVIGTTSSVTFTAANTGALTFPDTGTATEGFVTFECEADDDDTPSERVLLQGDVAGGMATMTVTGASGMGGRGLVDLSFVEGSFVLDTPTDDASGVPANDRMGILFASLGRTPALTLPVLPSGWRYEGFVTDLATGRTYSTGKFRFADRSDESDGTSLSRGPRPKPGVPGEDFLFDVPTVMRPAAQPGSITQVFVTIEAEPDDAAGPSALRVLDATVSPTAPTITDLTLTPVFPGGAAIFAQMSFNGD